MGNEPSLQDFVTPNRGNPNESTAPVILSATARRIQNNSSLRDSLTNPANERNEFSWQSTNIKLPIPHAILNLSLLFKANGFELFLVGGSVRDYLLGRTPSDFDFCTSATPSQMQDILRDYRLITIGAKYGTIGLRFGGIACEITTFRSERDYSDNRHPQSVAFESDIRADLGRRDFTINAMAFDILEAQIIDIFGGMADLRAGQIRAVGNANERFGEDGLRSLRAFSLVAKFGFDIESATIRAIVAQKSLLKNITKERICAEINKILQGRFAFNALKLMQKNDIFAMNVPKRFSAIPKKVRIYGVFLIFKDAKLRESLQNKRAKSIEMIFNALDSALKTRAICEKRAIFADLALCFTISDIRIALTLKCATRRKNRRIKKAFRPKILRFALKISGFDLQKLGFSGAQIGAIKAQLLREIYSGNLPNNRAILLRKTRRFA